MTSKDKIQSLIGFAIKSGKIIYGLDNISRYHKRKYLIIVCSSVSENTLERVKTQCTNTPIILSKKILVEDLVGKLNCKVVAILDKHMAVAMLSKLNLENYKLVSEVKVIG